jgi:hypothetical protein
MTIATLHEAGFQTVGAGLTVIDIGSPLFWETSEGRLAIVNWVFPETHPEWEVVPGPNCWPGLREANTIIDSLKGQADWVLIFAHWSDELFPYPRPEDRMIARELADIGADIVIGHHPHVVRGMEVIGYCPVFYSIGNYFFSDYPDPNKGTIIRQAPRNREGLGLDIAFRQGKLPEIRVISFWKKREAVVTDKLHRAIRRMKSVSPPIHRFNEQRYTEWYKVVRQRFNHWEYLWYFRLWSAGKKDWKRILGRIFTLP